MEFISFSMIMLKPLLWLLPVLVCGAVLSSPRFKGKMGERSVKRVVKKNLDAAIYREFSDVTIHTEGGTTQIDHIYVSPFGIFVIETKNMSGWIFGSGNQAQWTQTIYRNKFRFQNPLRQNYRHIKALESLLGVPLHAFKSVVVFAGDCTFKTEMPDEVRTRSNLVGYIRSFDARILSDSQVKDICNKIERVRLPPSRRVNRDHVNHLRLRHHGQAKPTGRPIRRRD